MNKLLVVLGPTSTGKTDLALLLAKKFNGELISADSRQVYRYLDIGTGKSPSKKSKIKMKNDFWEINDIKIWMYDVVDPEKRFNLYEYILKASEIIKKITSDNKLPILVGGTGLYIRSLIDGVSDFGNEGNQDLRKYLEGLGIEKIHERINKKDPDLLKKLNNSELKNKRRLIRILEKLLSKNTNRSSPGLDKDFNVLKIGLKTKREILDKKIKQRVIKRIRDGMIEESENLLIKNILSYRRMEELGLEYKYIAKFLKGEIKTRKELIEILTIKIRQFAKRQMTWFKKEKRVYWFDLGEMDYIKKIENQVLNWCTT